MKFTRLVNLLVTLLVIPTQLVTTSSLWAAGNSVSPAGPPSSSSGAPQPPAPFQPSIFPKPNEMLPESPIPENPSAPPQLFEKTPPDTFRCQRLFIYRGQKLGCDSNLRADAERLRPIISTVPDAIAQLDAYQTTQRRLRTTAFTGSAGLVLLASGFFLFQGSGRTALLLGGAGVFIGSLAYGLTAMHANEADLGRAIDTYNEAKPEDPIELQFKTGIAF